MTEEPQAELSYKARILSLNLRISIAEILHDDLSYRVDDIEEELDELWNAIDKLKGKQKTLKRIIDRLLRNNL